MSIEWLESSAVLVFHGEETDDLYPKEEVDSSWKMNRERCCENIKVWYESGMSEIEEENF